MFKKSIYYYLFTTEEEEKEESGFDTLSVDDLFKVNMPDWLPGDSKLHYYEVMSPSLPPSLLLFNSQLLFSFFLLTLVLSFSDERIRGGTSQRMASSLR